MSQPKHTPGPWYIVKIGNINKANAGHHSISNNGNREVGEIDVWFSESLSCKTPEEALANAKLISAALEVRIFTRPRGDCQLILK